MNLEPWTLKTWLAIKVIYKASSSYEVKGIAEVPSSNRI